MKFSNNPRRVHLPGCPIGETTVPLTPEISSVDGVPVLFLPFGSEPPSGILTSDLWVVDTETFGNYGNSALVRQACEPRLLQVYSPPENLVVLVDCLDSGYPDWFIRGMEEANKIKVFHNAMYDLAALASFTRANCRPDGIRDTMLGFAMLHAGRYDAPVNLKALCKQYLGIDIGKEEQGSAWGYPTLSSSQCEYAVRDVLYTHRLYVVLLGILGELSQYPPTFNPNFEAPRISVLEQWIDESEFTAVCAECEFTGMPLDLNRVSVFEEEVRACRDEMLATVVEMGASSLHAQKWNGLAVNEDSINADNRLLPFKYGRYYHTVLTKIQSAVSWAERSPLGRTSGEYKTFSTSEGTGRGGCRMDESKTGLTMQIIPKPSGSPSEQSWTYSSIRDCMVAPDGRQLIICDLSAAHGRIAADLSHDKNFQKIAIETEDPHAIVVLEMLSGLDREALPQFGLTEVPTFEEILKLKKSNKKIAALRDVAKTVFYSFLNRATLKTITKSSHGSGLTDGQVAAVNNAFTRLYATLSGFLEDQYAQIRDLCNFVGINKHFQFHWDKQLFSTQNYLFTISGSGRPFWAKRFEGRPPSPGEVSSPNWMQIESSIIKRAFITIYRWRNSNKDARIRDEVLMCAFVHDEMVFEAPDSVAEQVGDFAGKAVKASFDRALLYCEYPETPGASMLAKVYSQK